MLDTGVGEIFAIVTLLVEAYNGSDAVHLEDWKIVARGQGWISHTIDCRHIRRVWTTEGKKLFWNNDVTIFKQE